LRITGGQNRGHTIPVPPKSRIRPTTDKAREALFNILANHFNFEDINALDLFAGTGIISFELFSRGCRNITSVELYRQQVTWLIKTIQKLNINEITIHNADAFRFIKKTDNHYNLAFADPPYNFERTTQLPGLIFENNILKDNGLFVLEHSKQFSFNENPYFIDLKIYGAVHFSFFKNKP